MHYNKNVDKTREQKSKTEMVAGDRNTRKLKQRELVNRECLIIKMCFKFLFKTAGVCDRLRLISKPHYDFQFRQFGGQFHSAGPEKEQGER